MAEDKVFKYKGKTLEELQALTMEELASILPSNLRRKMNRGFTEAEQIFLKNFRAGQKNLKTHVRDLFVMPEMVGSKISIYSGKEFVQVTITEDMIPMRFGELVPTRKIAQHSGGGAKKTSIRK